MSRKQFLGLLGILCAAVVVMSFPSGTQQPHEIKRTLRLSGFKPPGAQETTPFLRDGKRMDGYTSVVDVGAMDCTDYTIPAYLSGYTVWTFELDPRNRAKCLYNLRMRMIQYTLIKIACGEKWKPNLETIKRPHVYVIEAGASSDYSCVTMSGEEFMTFAIPGKDGNAPVVPVDDIVPASESVYIFKIDTQGHETAVILGAQRTLRRSLVLAFEYWPLGAESNGLTSIVGLEEVYRMGFTCHDTGVHSYNLLSRPSEIHSYTDYLRSHAKEKDIIGSWDDLICFMDK